MANGEIMLMQKGNEYVVIIGQLTFPYYTSKTLPELAQFFSDSIATGKPFVIEMGVPSNMNGLPHAVINPAPGMVVIIQTKQDHERGRNMQKLVAVPHA